jgi:transcriptional regulator with XRE-family HTH domain
MYPAGLRLRQYREKLGLTYRDVERASCSLAMRRGRPDFILHISRLADIENRNVVPNIYRLYSLAVIYHLNVFEIAAWYEAPFQNAFQDSTAFPPPQTSLGEAFPSALERCQLESVPALDREATGFLAELPPGSAPASCAGPSRNTRQRYGYIGLSDRRMVPLLRPGSIVLIDTTCRKVEDAYWSSEYDRPLYFVELRDGYRCGWFQKKNNRLILQPHPLSRCVPEVWKFPDEAEVVGKVIGVTTKLYEPWMDPAEAPAARASSPGRAL